MTINEISNENKSCVKIPMFVDNFNKDDFNNEELEKTADFVFNKLSNKGQSFVFVSDNQQILNALNYYQSNRIKLNEEFNLMNMEYDSTLDIYRKYIHIDDEN